MKRLGLPGVLSLLLPLSTAVAMDVSEVSLVTGSLRLGMSSSDDFGYTILHELEEELDERMARLEKNTGLGASLSYRIGISRSILFGVSADYLRSGTMKQEDEFGEVIELVEDDDDPTSAKLGSYTIYGVALALQPGISITEQLMLFGEVGLGAYSAVVAGHTEELNASLNIGICVDYFLSDSMALELSAGMPFFLSKFVFLDEGYSLAPSPLQLSLGVTWVRQ